ncbi:MAG: TolC family protein [Planctomycetales bacterium]|nr:TolC family protein [Planctomycetales bacterium]
MAVLFLLGWVGCKTQDDYKAQADEEVYSILDEKWRPEHGVKANYRISDVAGDPNDLTFDPNWIPPDHLTLAQAVAIATARSRQYQSQKESLYTTTLNLTLQRYDFVRQWFGTIDGRYTRNAEDESVGAGGQVGFEQLLADGTQIGAGIAIDWVQLLTGDPDTSLGSVLSGSISKPLLRGSTKEVVQENLTQAERNVLYQIRTFSRYRKEFVVSIVQGYLRTLQSQDRVKNAQSNYTSLQAAYEESTLRAQAGKLAPMEAAQTEQQMLQARDNLAGAERTYQQALDEFKLLLSLPVDAQFELDSGVLEELSLMRIAEPNFPVDNAVQIALENRLDLATAFDQLDDARRKVEVAADALRAQLDLVASANVPSTPDTDLERLRFHEGTYNAGLILDLPLNKKTEAAAYRRALISCLQAQRDYELTVDEVKLDIRNAYRSLIEAARRHQIQKNSLELAQERVNSTKMLLQAGRAQSRDLLDSQDSLLSAQNDTTSTLVNYMLAKLNFYRDIEILNVKPDGLWEPLEKTDEKLF